MRFLFGAFCGVVLGTALSVGAGSTEYWQQQQQLDALRQLLLQQQMQESQRQLEQQRMPSFGRPPC